MAKFYKSGFEAYCRTAAAAYSMDDNLESWSEFGREVFNIMDPVSDPNCSRNFSRSPLRGTGRSNRPAIFEECWLNGEYAKDWADRAEREERASLGRPLNVEEKARCRDKARENCEREAITRCCESAIASGTDSAIRRLIDFSGDFAIDFHAKILPYIIQGLTTETVWSDSDIRRFQNVIDDLANELCECRLSEQSRIFSLFIRALFAGLVYGPNHWMALNQPERPTHEYNEGEDGGPEDLNQSWDTLCITQMLDSNVAYIGDTLKYATGSVIFIGRGLESSNYLDICKAIFEGDEVLDRLCAAEPAVFHIPSSCDSTSNRHGLILSYDNDWFYYDLKSKNGTSYMRGDSIRQVSEGLIRLQPGDRLFLGSPPAKPGACPARSTATLLVSSFVGSTAFRPNSE